MLPRAGAWVRLEAYGQASAANPLDRYVWGLEYIDAPIIRYRDVNVNGDYGDQGDSLLYYLHDANFDVTGLVNRDDTGVVERYMYEPYGRVTVLNGAADADESVNDWSADADNASDWSNELLYAGYRRDAESALYHVRNRYYHPTLGRWVSRDPVGYEGGRDLYAYAKASPACGLDPLGLQLDTVSHSCCQALAQVGVARAQYELALEAAVASSACIAGYHAARMAFEEAIDNLATCNAFDSASIAEIIRESREQIRAGNRRIPAPTANVGCPPKVTRPRHVRKHLVHFRRHPSLPSTLRIGRGGRRCWEL
jgi:RHS repeat-associated protein